mmetsp:Transcript_29091/g.44689  ORF Transcript_29091/g.44689 Transcript_29091/m.44689 type:complete len:163 (+) Transcript_29091:101-589(+)
MSRPALSRFVQSLKEETAETIRAIEDLHNGQNTGNDAPPSIPSEMSDEEWAKIQILLKEGNALTNASVKHLLLSNKPRSQTLMSSGQTKSLSGSLTDVKLDAEAESSTSTDRRTRLVPFQDSVQESPSLTFSCNNTGGKLNLSQRCKNFTNEILRDLSNEEG